jgi:hypothetical protein
MTDLMHMRFYIHHPITTMRLDDPTLAKLGWSCILDTPCAPAG